MKNLFKKLQKAINKESAPVRQLLWAEVVILAGLIVWLIASILMLFIKHVDFILGILFLFLLFFGESLADIWKKKQGNEGLACKGCAGCGYYYPTVRTVMFTALRQCAPALSFHPPETETAIVSSVQSMADAVPRFQFKILKKPGKQTELSNEVLTSCLQEAVNDAFAAYVSAFAGCKMQGLYIEEIREQNMYTYLIAVLPICEKTLPHIRKKEQQRISGEKQMLSTPNERVYDDDF